MKNDIKFLFNVEKNKSARLSVISTQFFISFSGSGTCSISSRQVRTSYFFFQYYLLVDRDLYAHNQFLNFLKIGVL